jgi:hypothetical protein
VLRFPFSAFRFLLFVRNLLSPWDRAEYPEVGRGWIDVCCFWFQLVLRFPFSIPLRTLVVAKLTTAPTIAQLAINTLRALRAPREIYITMRTLYSFLTQRTQRAPRHLVISRWRWSSRWLRATGERRGNAPYPSSAVSLRMECLYCPVLVFAANAVALIH